jgi:hypothetical protein
MRPKLRYDPHVGLRYRGLRRAGLSDVDARTLAADKAYDVNAVLELVDRGCPPDLAARVLAPLGCERDLPWLSPL